MCLRPAIPHGSLTAQPLDHDQPTADLYMNLGSHDQNIEYFEIARSFLTQDLLMILLGQQQLCDPSSRSAWNPPPPSRRNARFVFFVWLRIELMNSWSGVGPHNPNIPNTPVCAVSTVNSICIRADLSGCYRKLNACVYYIPRNKTERRFQNIGWSG